MAKAKSVETKKPTGLTVTRSGNSFACAWKIGDADYGAGQWFKYRINGGSWTAWDKISSSATSKNVSLGANMKTVVSFEFAVKGKRKKYKKTVNKKEVEYEPTSSTNTKVWKSTIPQIASFTYSRTSSNAGTFSWSVNVSDNDTAIFDHVVLETATMRSDAAPGAWSGSNQPASGSASYTETLSGSNLVRWARVKAVGPAGKSGWMELHHAYGNPSMPSPRSASSNIANSTTVVTVDWNAPMSGLYPIDTITIQYATAIPTDANLSAPSGGWSDVLEVAANGGYDKVIAYVSDVVAQDECMWIRLKAKHDDSYVYSSGILAGKGALKTPEISATPNATTGDVAISITEKTSCTVAKTVIFYRSEKRPNYDQIVAILEHGTTTTTVHIEEIKTSVAGHVETTCFGAYAIVGYTSGLSINPKMRSGIDLDSDIVAAAPAWVHTEEGASEGSVRITWPWSWSAATSAELSWADHEDAWESTAEPSTYMIDDKNVSGWVIANLKVGKRWFFRVRLIMGDGSDRVVGPWSDIVDYNLSSIPDKPALMLSKTVMDANGTVTARWVYTAADDTTQAYADICMATISGGVITYGDVIAHVSENRTVDITGTWTTGQTYYFCLRLTSSSGRQSEWSDPVAVFITPPVTINLANSNNIEINSEITSFYYEDGAMYKATITPYPYYSKVTSANLADHTYYEGDVESGTYIRHEYSLFSNSVPLVVSMPLSVTVTGAGDAGTTIVSIVRAEDYHIERPDGSDVDGFEGEHIATKSQTGEAAISITTDDLVGSLDDGAKYILICTVIDEYGQTASLEVPFTVGWYHQAGKPSATVKIDEYQRIAIITPIAPSNYVSGDVCDIYRISADKPELIVKGAAFGTSYVDPYPAFGDFCGHRIVTKTANGDYITEDNELAWFLCDSDVDDIIEEQAMVIDVDGEQIELPYNIGLQNSWAKDFKRTAYLGGAVKGDWNPAVMRDITATTVILRGADIDKQIAIRGLAGYAGIAHIRTPDGSSVAANIEVREQASYDSRKVSYTLTINVIDPDQPEGMTYAEWQSANPAE